MTGLVGVGVLFATSLAHSSDSEYVSPAEAVARARDTLNVIERLYRGRADRPVIFQEAERSVRDACVARSLVSDQVLMSSRGRVIPVFEFGRGAGRPRIFVGGVHSDEGVAVSLSWTLLGELCRSDSENFSGPVLFIPHLNVDGFVDLLEQGREPTRDNSEGQDLNRWWTVDSERVDVPSEVRGLMQMWKRVRPERVMALHAALGILDPDGWDQHRPFFEEWWREIERRLGAVPLPIRDYRTYYDPVQDRGSMGWWAETVFSTPSLTIELPHPRNTESVETLREMERRFLPLLRILVGLK